MKKYSILSYCSMAAVAAAMTPQVAFAQASADEASGIQDIIVTARRTAENLQTTPVAVTVPTGEVIDKAQVVSIQDLPRLVPGIVVQPSTGQPASAFIGIRGQAASDALLAIDQAVGQYFDGVYIARSSGALFNFVDVERVEVLRGAQGTLFGRNTTGGAVSIISKKPTGDLGGSLRLRYGNFNSWETTGVLNLPIAGDKVALRLVGQHMQNGGYARNLSFGTPLGGDNVDFVRGTLRIAPGDGRMSVTIAGDYSSRTSDGQITGLKSYNRNPTTGANNNATANGLLLACSGPTARALCPVKGPAGDSYGNYAIDTRGNSPFYDVALSIIPYSRAETWGVGVTTEYELSDATAFKAITAWRGVETESLSDNDGTPYHLSGGQFVGEGNIISQHQFSQELQLSTKALDDRLQVIVGAFYFNEAGNDLSLSRSAYPLFNPATAPAPRVGYNDGDIKNSSIAGFGQFNFNITPQIRFTAGARYTKDKRSILRRNRLEDVDLVTGIRNGVFTCSLVVAAGAPCEALTKAKFDYWSYTAGFDWQPTDNIFAYIKTSKASRAGGFNPRAIGATPLTFNPETVKDYELGLKVDLLDRKVRLNAALFQTDYDGIQRTVPAIINGILSNTIINAASARIRGLELELTVQPTRDLQLGAAATFLDPKFKEFTIPLTLTTFQDVRDTPYSFAPKKSVSVYADYTIPLGGSDLNLRADYAWRSKQATTGPLIGPGFQEQFKDTAIIAAYGVLNGQIAWSMDAPNIELALYGQNLTKKKYITRLLAIENSLGVTAYSPGMPRTYGLRLTYKFGGEE
jgi:iron complex outermembrane receptor protein